MIEQIITIDFFIGLLAATVRLSAPILLAALGETISQRSGVYNLGIEGTMTLGAFGGFLGVYFSGNLWVGVAIGMLAGASIGLLTSFMCVLLRANQSVFGVMIRILCVGLVAYMIPITFGGSFIHSPNQFTSINIPVLSQLPFVGPIIFQQNILVYLAYLLVPIAAFVLYKTTYGLKVMSVGENPRAADSSGVNVYSTRIISIIIGTMLIGLGGSYVVLAYVPILASDVVAGRGWVALALVTFGRWDPVKLLAGVFLFCITDAFQLRLQAIGVPIPYQFLIMSPYVLTMIVMVLARKNDKARSVDSTLQERIRNNKTNLRAKNGKRDLCIG